MDTPTRQVLDLRAFRKDGGSEHVNWLTRCRARPYVESMVFRLTRALFIGFFAASPAAASEDAFTLYRNSALDPKMRVHVASFDTHNGEGYNKENCWLAADLFGRQVGVSVRFWCEKGSFRE